MLTPRGNFHAIMEGRGGEWLPFDLPMTPPVIDRMEAEMGTREVAKAFGTDFRGLGISPGAKPGAWIEAWRRIGFEPPVDVEIGSYGILHRIPSRESVGSSYHFREMLHPLAAVNSVRQLEELPWPDISAPELFAKLPMGVARAHAEGAVAIGQLACTIFELSWYVRGMENLFADLAEENGIGDWLLDWFTERSVRFGTRYAREGVDMVLLGDDVGTQRGMMVAVPWWRKHLKPRLRRVIAAIRGGSGKGPWIAYHSDGDIRAIIPDLIEIGVDILNPVQPECLPVEETVARYKDRLAFWGMIGTQTTMPFGTTADVRSAVQGCARLAREGARVVVAPTHVLEPDVPWENIRALAEEVRGTRLSPRA